MPQDMEDAHAEYCLRESDWFIKGSLRLMADSPNQINWMSHPSSIQKAESKIYQLQIAKSKGFRIPDTLITNDAKKVRSFFQQAGHIIAKPLRLGYFDYGEKQTCVYTSEVELKDIEEDMSIKVAPVIYQELIPKRYDIRVTVVGTQLFATAIHSQDIPSASIDWRRSDTSDLLHTKHVLPDNIASMCINYMAALDLNYGAIDLILTPDGEYIFLEINPNGQWAWMEDRLNLPISNSIATWLFAHSR